MSLKKRIKLLKAINQKAIIESRKNDTSEIKVIVFPLDWWKELSAECEQK